MNTNDLPPAAKLAALIEAGRAANPDIQHGKGKLYSGLSNQACAIGFACLGAGATRAAINCDSDLDAAYVTAAKLLNVQREPEEYPGALQDWVWQRVIMPNDKGTPLDEICASLREGELAKVAA